ncbi:MAG: LysR substrate-binding domain-containing protein [Myxococcota bacterium]
MATIIKTPQIAALVRMVRMNMGLSFLPQLALRHELESGGLHALQFASDELHRGIWLSLKLPEEFPARAAFVECMQEVVEVKSRAVVE